MTYLEDVLVSRITGGSTLAGSRVYPVRQPQTPTYDLIVYQRISGAPQYTHGGDSGLEDPRFQFTLWSKTYAGVQALAAQFRALFSGYKDESNGIQGVMIDFDMDDSDEQTGLVSRIIDLRIKYKG